MRILTVQTSRSKQVVDITSNINQVLRESSFSSGVCHIFVLHTTAALSVADLDPGTDLDMLNAYTEMIPRLEFHHPHDPSHAPDHILAALIGPSVSLPVENGKLLLGTWQSVVLFDFDGPRSRKIAISLIREAE